MKKHSVESINYPRIILYLVAIIACGLLSFVHFYVTPRFQQKQRINEITDFYNFGNYKEAILKCQELLQEHPNQHAATFWLGKSYDGLVKQISSQENRIQTLRKWASSPFFSDKDRQTFGQQADNITTALKSWQKTEELTAKAIACYQKILAIAPNWSRLVDIAEAHLQAGRYGQTLDILSKLPHHHRNPTKIYIYVC